MSSFQNLEETFRQLANRFSRVSQHINNYEETLNKQMKRFHQTVNTPLNVNIKNDLPIVNIFKELQRACKKKCDAWLQTTDTLRKNTNFRDKHSDSLLIYVYGKVKSGKSSLGNYVAYGRHDPSAEDIAQLPQVNFDIEAKSASCGEVDAETLDKIRLQKEGTRREKKFLVDFLEATACIQYFTKPGLTWVDSPGIHSSTPSNGKLAQEYLDSADLVLYTTRARNAFQDADRAELVHIVRKGKPFLLLITRSDASEADVDEQGNIINTLRMLPPDDLKKIRAWGVTSILETLNTNNVPCSETCLEENILVISSLYAEKNPDHAGWKASGMADFCQKIQFIAHSEGVKIKREAPLKNIASQIERIEQGGMELVDNIMHTRMHLKEQRIKIDRACEQKKFQCATELQSKVIPLAKKYYGQDEVFNKEAQLVASTVITQKQEELARIIVQDLGDMLKAMPLTDSITFKKFEDIVQTTTYHTKRKSSLGACLGAVFGGAVGFFLGGPAGAAAGVSLGAGAGNAVGAQFDDNGTTTVVVGNNSQDVARDAVAILEQKSNEILDIICKKVLNECIYPLENWIYDIEKQLNEYMNFLSNTRNDIHKDLEQ